MSLLLIDINLVMMSSSNRHLSSLFSCAPDLSDPINSDGILVLSYLFSTLGKQKL